MRLMQWAMLMLALGCGDKDDDTGTLDVEAYSDAPAEPEIQE